MGKSDRKSRKRKRSESRDRLAALEDKVSRLIDVLSKSGVRVPRARSPLSFSQSGQSSQEFREVSDEEASGISAKDESGNLSEAVSTARERLGDPHVSGVYEHPSSVYRTEESTQPFPTNRNTLSSLAAEVINPVTEESPSSPPPADAAATAFAGSDELSVDTLSMDLFGPNPEATHQGMILLT